MSAASDYVGIRGWAATVMSITPIHKKGKLDYVAGYMRLLPEEENRDIFLAGKELSLDVFFHCYTPEVAHKFFKQAKANDTLIVSGDLNARDWTDDPEEPSTNFWLDEFVVDESKHRVAALAGKITVADDLEYAIAANHRYRDDCLNCGGAMSTIVDDARKYCKVCDE